MTRGETRTVVLDSVLALLDGSQRLTYEAVASHAGVSRQTVYTHFPTRADLLVAAVDRAREAAGLDVATQSVYEAPTAAAALSALVDLHVSFVPTILRAYVAVEYERAADPDVQAAFARRSGGRRQLARHVATRLHAEGQLASPWTVPTAGDLVHALTTGALTAHFLREAEWTETELRDRLLVALRRTLLNDTTTEES